MENICKKPPTNFSIDCILSKDENQNVDYPRSPVNHPLNKVLDNNPWISKFPLALTFKPTTHRKLNFPLPPNNPTPSTFFNFQSPSGTSNYPENVVKVTQHFTSVHNHFYSHSPSTSSESTSNSDDFKSPKFENLKDDKSSSDNDNLSLNLSAKAVLSTSPNFSHKCSVCSKSFESCELLDVGRKLRVQKKQN